MSNSLQPHGLKHTKLPHPSPTSRACLNSCPSSQWCHPTISSSAIPFSSCSQSFPASRSFPMCQLFTPSGQRTGASVSASVLPMNIQGWFPLGLTGLISLLSKGLLMVFSNTTFWKYPFFGAQPSLWSDSYLHTWLLERPQLWLYGHLLGKWSLLFNTLLGLHSFSCKEQASFYFMAAVTICSDFGAPKNKVWHCFHSFPIYLPWSDGTRCHDLRFLNVEL